VGGGEGFGDLHDRSAAVFVQRFPQNVSRVVNKGREGIERTRRQFSATERSTVAARRLPRFVLCSYAFITRR